MRRRRSSSQPSDHHPPAAFATRIRSASRGPAVDGPCRRRRLRPRNHPFGSRLRLSHTHDRTASATIFFPPLSRATTLTITMTQVFSLLRHAPYYPSSHSSTSTSASHTRKSNPLDLLRSPLPQRPQPLSSRPASQSHSVTNEQQRSHDTTLDHTCNLFFVKYQCFNSPRAAASLTPLLHSVFASSTSSCIVHIRNKPRSTALV